MFPGIKGFCREIDQLSSIFFDQLELPHFLTHSMDTKPKSSSSPLPNRIQKQRARIVKRCELKKVFSYLPWNSYAHFSN